MRHLRKTLDIPRYNYCKPKNKSPGGGKEGLIPKKYFKTRAYLKELFQGWVSISSNKNITKG